MIEKVILGESRETLREKSWCICGCTCGTVKDSEDPSRGATEWDNAEQP